MSTITTHVLDVSAGCPAAEVSVILESQTTNSAWVEVGRGATDADGRLKEIAACKELQAGVYRLSFGTGAYFAARQLATLYPHVTIVFEVQAGQAHYHIPLLLSPFGYSTYRGS
jgi:5-hydroxyisourate hydrolase